MQYFSIVAAVLALIFAGVMASFVSGQAEGNERMAELAAAIHGGAKAFLFAEFLLFLSRFYLYASQSVSRRLRQSHFCSVQSAR